MGRGIIKIKDKYFVWSSIVDAPVTHGMNKKELKNFIEFKYGDEGLKKLPERLKRVEEKGASWIGETDLEETIGFNRAGENEECISKEEIYDIYTK